MPHYLKFFPSNYVSVADLDGHGDVHVTIKQVTTQEVKNRDGKKEVCPVLEFQNSKKGLILNRTCADVIAALYGTDTDRWVGKRITLYIEYGVEAFGKKWDVVRIREKAPPPPKAKGQAGGVPAYTGTVTATDPQPPLDAALSATGHPADPPQANGDPEEAGVAESEPSAGTEAEGAVPFDAFYARASELKVALGEERFAIVLKEFDLASLDEVDVEGLELQKSILDALGTEATLAASGI